MSDQPTTTAPTWRRIKASSWAIPIAFAVLVVGVMGVSKLVKSPDTDTVAFTAGNAAQQGVENALQGLGQQATPTTVAPAPVPQYDYLACTAWQPGDAPCVPLLVWPLTQGAMELIGYQQGGIKGELSTVKTRLVADQIRQMGTGIDACQLWLSLERDKDMNPTLTVWPNQGKAPAGAVRLVDCSPSSKTQGTVPTEGVS